MNDPIKRVLWAMKENRKVQMGVVVGVVAVVAIIVAGYVLFGSKDEVVFTADAPQNTAAVGRQSARAIDGVATSFELANKYPVAVVIDNLFDEAKPQSGIDRANVVYEVLAEGGITRWLAVFASGEEIEKIGPVRSARPYFVSIAQEYNALYAHVGGSPQGLADIDQYNIPDLNQFYDSQYYWRAKERFAPHNVYTNSRFLSLALRDKDVRETGDYQPWMFKKEKGNPTASQHITLDFSTFKYKVEYDYDAGANDYIRSQGGVLDVSEDGVQLRAKNVVVQKVKIGMLDASRLSIDLVGDGEGFVFLDGKTNPIRWERETRSDRTRYHYEDGREVQLNPGTTWIELVPEGRDVSVIE